MWSAKLVLESTPRWLRNFYLFESGAAQLARLHKLRDDQPPRNKQKNEPERSIEIYEGDFNENIHRMLREHPIPEKEATFCVFDQRTFECDWQSVETVAKHKPSGRKIELFYFFPEGWVNRGAAGLKIDREQRLEKWWGASDWDKLLSLSGALRAQCVSNRFRSTFNYKHVYPFPIYEKPDQGGRVMYYMIHASDHDEAPVLMNRAYGKALDIKETEIQLEFMKEALEALHISATVP
jgi:three-Cys-motif partner protein